MLVQPKCDSRAWAQENFQGCELGDARRSARLELFAQQAADRPAGSLPKMSPDWSDVKGIYRLLDRPEATLSSVTQTHRSLVARQTRQFLVVCDTTHVDFGWQRDLPDAGPIGKGRGQGFLLHSGLLVDAGDGALVGVAGQIAHVRDKKRRGRQSDAQRLKRWRESELWIELMEQIGSPPAGAQYIHVCDSAADNFEAFATASRLGTDFVIRVGRLHRKVLADGEKTPLSAAVSQAKELGSYRLHLPRGNGRQARTAQLRVSALDVRLPVPSAHASARIRRYVAEGGGDLAAAAIVVEELDPPQGDKPIRWILLTSLPAASLDDAWKIIEWYENRWIVEEWHKALKTGCSLESRQLQSVERLLPLAGVLSVVAVRLVQLKHAARTSPDQPAASLRRSCG